MKTKNFFNSKNTRELGNIKSPLFSNVAINKKEMYDAEILYHSDIKALNDLINDNIIFENHKLSILDLISYAAVKIIPNERSNDLLKFICFMTNSGIDFNIVYENNYIILVVNYMNAAKIHKKLFDLEIVQGELNNLQYKLRSIYETIINQDKYMIGLEDSKLSNDTCRLKTEINQTILTESAGIKYVEESHFISNNNYDPNIVTAIIKQTSDGCTNLINLLKIFSKSIYIFELKKDVYIISGTVDELNLVFKKVSNAVPKLNNITKQSLQVILNITNAFSNHLLENNSKRNINYNNPENDIDDIISEEEI